MWRATACAQLWRPSLETRTGDASSGSRHAALAPTGTCRYREQGGGGKILHVLTVDPSRRLILLLLIPHCLGLRGENLLFFLFFFFK